MRKNRKRRKLWVIKAGSRMVIEGGAPLLRHWMNQVSVLSKKFHIDVIWVTSGAIATARRERSLNLNLKSKLPLAQKQALSAIGQPKVMNLYNHALRKLEHTGAQVLLTADDLRHPGRRKNLVQTLQTLISWKVLPILNENDTVSTEEIQFGDNDQLSALVAKHMNADRLILLTDVDGLFESDPKTNPDAQMISRLRTVSLKLIKSLDSDMTRRRPGDVGTGGMLSKILAAQSASRQEIQTHLVRGSLKNALIDIAEAIAADNEESLPGTMIGKYTERS